MSDDAYSRAAPELALDLAQKHVHAVYETRLPLGAEAARQLGCVVVVARHAQRRPLGEGFDLSDLQA